MIEAEMRELKVGDLVKWDDTRTSILGTVTQVDAPCAHYYSAHAVEGFYVRWSGRHPLGQEFQEEFFTYAYPLSYFDRA